MKKDKNKYWYVMRNDTKQGPFTYFEMLEMIQAKELREFDIVYHEKFQSMKPLLEVEDFSIEKIKKIYAENKSETKNIFFERKNKRAIYESSVIVHDNLKVFKGYGIEISAGGAGLYIDECTHLRSGQKVYLHFKPGNGVPPFNAVCQVVSVRQVQPKQQAKLLFGVKFVSITQDIRKAICDYTESKANAA